MSDRIKPEYFEFDNDDGRCEIKYLIDENKLSGYELQVIKEICIMRDDAVITRRIFSSGNEDICDLYTQYLIPNLFKYNAINIFKFIINETNGGLDYFLDQVKNTDLGFNAIRSCIFFNNLEFLKLLKEMIPDEFQKYAGTLDILSFAILYDYIDMVKFLISTDLYNLDTKTLKQLLHKIRDYKDSESYKYLTSILSEYENKESDEWVKSYLFDIIKKPSGDSCIPANIGVKLEDIVNSNTISILTWLNNNKLAYYFMEFLRKDIQDIIGINDDIGTTLPLASKLIANYKIYAEIKSIVYHIENETSVDYINKDRYKNALKFAKENLNHILEEYKYNIDKGMSKNSILYLNFVKQYQYWTLLIHIIEDDKNKLFYMSEKEIEDILDITKHEENKIDDCK